jgi:intracellular sulfur oxidation DsrE/DsrF family protein
MSEVVQSGFRKTGEDTKILNESYFVEFVKATPGGLKPLEYPLIAGYGGVVKLPNAIEKPRPGAKVLFDTTADAKPSDVNKGLERAARLLNLYGATNLKASDVKIAVVVHGEATKSILNDAFYGARFQTERNPNLPLIRELKQAGVEILVCGQALNYKGFPESAVVNDAFVADSALGVIINKQSGGHVCVPVP